MAVGIPPGNSKVKIQKAKGQFKAQNSRSYS
jgi:hypothetical protein